MSLSEVPRRRGWLVPTLFTLACLPVLIGLGAWQLQRLQWKNQLEATVTARLAAQPSYGVPPRSTWAGLDRDALEYRRVFVPVEFMHDDEALVYTAGSAFRPDIKGAGYWVLTPARLPGGSVVVINRGFVPLDRKDPATRREGQVTGIVDVVGVLRWPDERGMFTPADEPKNNVWFIRNPTAIGEAKQWGPVAPFLIDQERPSPPGALPSAAPLEVRLPNNHLGYALTWFGLAATLIGVYVALMIGRRRCI